MLLAIAATEIEMKPFLQLCGKADLDAIKTAVSGVGPVEAAVTVTRLLERHHAELTGVINFGIGGGYITQAGGVTTAMLDICLAETECLGDFGVSMNNRIEPFANTSIAVSRVFTLDRRLHGLAGGILADAGYSFKSGNFVTVNGASGTRERGAGLCSFFNGVCENMEGWAVARACQEFCLPMLEVRVISNLVEDRPGTPWKIAEASQMAASAVYLVATHLQEIV